ncbi:MAG: 4Fe-4S binding protein [Bacteroidales bacterium]|nr:4Fe-4S binding protein [Bacteroidales bacterium]
MKKISNSNWPKNILQWGILAAIILFISGLIPSQDAIDPEAYCPMGGLEALATYGVRGSLPCSMSSLQILMGIALAAAVVLFSKLFCGYICPLGTIEDLLMKLRSALKIKAVSIKNGSVADKALRIFKYLLLFYIFYTTTAASELVCKEMDPYYAMATLFKGEIVLWMSLTSVALLFLGGFIVDRFWCRYVCPLGALSNTLKYWIWVLAVAAAWLGLGALGVNIPWWWQFALVCAGGYVLELVAKPRLHVLNIVKDAEKCVDCGLCDKKCPYHIPVSAMAGGKVCHVDCTLCQECVTVCSKDALAVSCKSGSKGPGLVSKTAPAVIAVLLIIAGMLLGRSIELPTINEKWGMENVDPANLETLKVEGLRSVKCFGSSMAFKAKLEKIAGIYGVKTYVGTHTADITYDPSKITPEKIQESIFTPSVFRVNSLDPKALDKLKIYTIRTEKMTDKLDLNYFGLQLRLTGKRIYGVESEYECPLVVRVFVDPEEELDEAWFKEVVELKSLDMPVHGGGVKSTPVDFEFVRMEKGVSYIDTPEYLHKMFSPFKAEFKSRLEKHENDTQMLYELVDQNYEKPIILRGMPFVSNHLSANEGIIGVYLDLNSELQPAIMVRYAAPMTAERIWELLTMKEWTITYSAEDIRQVPAKMTFEEPGQAHEWKGSLEAK